MRRVMLSYDQPLALAVEVTQGGENGAGRAP